MSDFKPGTVAVATVRGVPNVRIFRCGGPGTSGREQVPFWWSAEYVIDWRSHDDRHVTDVRPLVVLDLNDGGDYWTDGVSTVHSLLRNLRNPGDNVRFTDLANAIEAQTRPPKPSEPTGLGAVVEDANGLLWVLYTHHENTAPWTEGSTSVEWDDVPAVRVLSEGVTP